LSGSARFCTAKIRGDEVGNGGRTTGSRRNREVSEVGGVQHLEGNDMGEKKKWICFGKRTSPHEQV